MNNPQIYIVDLQSVRVIINGRADSQKIAQSLAMRLQHHLDNGMVAGIIENYEPDNEPLDPTAECDLNILLDYATNVGKEEGWMVSLGHLLPSNQEHSPFPSSLHATEFVVDRAYRNPKGFHAHLIRAIVGNYDARSPEVSVITSVAGIIRYNAIINYKPKESSDDE